MGVGDITWEMIARHPGIPFTNTTDVDPFLKARRIDQRVLWCIKFLADNGIPVWWMSGVRATTDTCSDHRGGRAADIRNRRGDDPLVRPADVLWVKRVFGLLDSLTGPQRPTQVGGPHLYKPKTVTWRDGTPASRDGRTEWFANPRYPSYVHIGFGMRRK